MKTSEWDQIENPVTGERLRFISRDVASDSATVEILFPVGGLAVIEHRHPGWEKFEVQAGMLDLTADGLVYRLGPGEEFTVTSEFHFPANVGAEDAVVLVTASPAGFFERGIRAAFGLARDGGVAPDGRPRDILALALVSERGAYQIAGPPRWLWLSLMTVLGWVAVLVGKRRQVERYWPPELERPWHRKVRSRS